MDFETIDFGLTYGHGQHLWVSALSRQGAVHGVPRASLPGVNPSELTLPELEERAHFFREAIRTGTWNEDWVRETSAFLGRLVFGVPEVRALFDRTRGVAAHRRRNLVVRIQAVPVVIAALPWELLPDPESSTAEFLTLSRDVRVVRLARARTYPMSAVPVPPPLRLLLVLACPSWARDKKDMTVPFDIYEEKRSLLGALKPLAAQGLIEIDVEDRPTVENLQRRIGHRARGYHLLHYIGYATPEGPLLEDRQGCAVPIKPDEFMKLLKPCPDLRLVFFAGCQTAQSPQGANVPEKWPEMLSLADLCVRDACPSVIGMQAVLPFRTERLFARFFYHAVANGRSPVDAVTLARAAVHEDPHVGGGRFDWAVPCLFLGGEPPGRLIDSSVAPTPLPRSLPRTELKLDFEEGEREFFARHADLRRVIDFLMGKRPSARLLWIFESTAGEQTRLIDRALDDVGEEIEYLLTVSVGRLLQKEDPARYLYDRVAGLLTSRDGRSRLPDATCETGLDCWEYLIGEVVRLPFVLVLLDREPATREQLELLAPLIQLLIARRTFARLIVVSPAIQTEPDWDFLHEWRETIKLSAYTFAEIHSWIRHNLPALARIDSEVLSALADEHALHLEQWRELEDEYSRGQEPRLSVLAGEIARRARASRRRGAADTQATTRKQPSRLRVACAGTDFAGRQKEFAAALSSLAGQSGVGGRMRSGSDGDFAPGLGELSTIPSPFSVSDAEPSTWRDKSIPVIETAEAEARQWTERLLQEGMEIVVLDFFAVEEWPLWQEIVQKISAKNALVLGAVGLEESSRPVYPGWLPEVLTVGPLAAHRRSIPSPYWDAHAGKPDLFAPESIRDEVLETVVLPDALTPPTAAILQGIVAAVLVWATDRRLSAAGVRDILCKTADPIAEWPAEGDRHARLLNLPAALEHVRTSLIQEALARGTLSIEALVAAVPLQAPITVALVDKLTRDGKLRKSSLKGIEQYSLPG